MWHIFYTLKIGYDMQIANMWENHCNLYTIVEIFNDNDQNPFEKIMKIQLKWDLYTNGSIQTMEYNSICIHLFPYNICNNTFCLVANNSILSTCLTFFFFLCCVWQFRKWFICIWLMDFCFTVNIHTHTLFLYLSFPLFFPVCDANANEYRSKMFDVDLRFNERKKKKTHTNASFSQPNFISHTNTHNLHLFAGFARQRCRMIVNWISSSIRNNIKCSVSVMSWDCGIVSLYTIHVCAVCALYYACLLNKYGSNISLAVELMAIFFVFHPVSVYCEYIKVANKIFSPKMVKKKTEIRYCSGISS